MQCQQAIEQYWNTFLLKTGRTPDTPMFFCGYMGPTEAVANELLALILSGNKTATTSSMLSYQTAGEPLPVAGALSIVADWDGNPRCVIETVKVTVLPFSEMTFEICKREGEDECLRTWQDTHFEIFTAEGKELGYTFAWDSPVVFEDFKVIYQ